MNRQAFSLLSYAYRLSPSRRVAVHMQIMAHPDIKKKAIIPRNSHHQANKLPLTNSKTTRHGFSSNVLGICIQNELKMLNTNDFWQGLYLARPIMSMAIQRHVLQKRTPSLSNHSTPSSMGTKLELPAFDLSIFNSKSKKGVAHFMQNSQKETDKFSDFLYYGWDLCEKMLPVVDNAQRKFTRDHSHSRLLAFRPLVAPRLVGTHPQNVTDVTQDQPQVAKRKTLYPYILCLVLTNIIQIYNMLS